MKKGVILLAGLLLTGIMAPLTWGQSIEDISWMPASPVAGAPLKFSVKASNPGPETPICIKLLTPGGTPAEQTHSGIGVRVSPPMEVRFRSSVVYAAPGEYEVKAVMLANDCKSELKKAEKPVRVERIKVGKPPAGKP